MSLAIPDDLNAGDLCPHCGADRMGCDVKTNLGGRHCCDDCSHFPPTDAPKETTR